MATIAASYYGNKLTDEKGLTITSSQTTQEEPVSEEPVSQEPVPQESMADGATAPSLPDDNIESIAGGGFGRPSWAPLNADTATMSLQGSTASNFIAKVTGTYKRTIIDIQRDLIDIDDQIRVLRTNEFIIKRDETDQASKINEARKKYLVNVSEISKNEKLIQFYDKKINDLIKPESVNTSGKFSEIVKQKFPQKNTNNGSFTYPKENNAKELNFDLWRESAFNKFKSEFPDDPIGIKPKDNEDSNRWWSRISNLTSSASAQKSEIIESELNELIDKKTNSITKLEIFKESDSKSDYDEVLEKLLSVRTKLKDIRNQIKELQNKRELILVELSNYELPKGFFAEKALSQKTTLPTGEERDQIIRSIKDVEQQIKEKQTEISDYISDNIQDDGKLNANSTSDYNRKNIEMANLKSRRDNLILKLEGREPAKLQELAKEIAAVSTWKDMVRELKLTPEKEKKYLNPKLISLFSSFETVLNQSEDILEENIEKYYDIFAKGYKSHLQTSGYTTLIKALYQLNQDLQGNCQFNKGDEVYVVTNEIERLYYKGKITKLIFDDNGGEKVCTSARISVDETGKLGFTNDWPTRMNQEPKNPPEEVLVEIQQLNIVTGSKTDTKYVQYKREAIPKLLGLSTKLDRIQRDLIAKTDKSKKDKTIDLKLLFDSAKTFFNDGKLPKNTYGLLNLYATQKEKFNELIKKLTWENTKGFLLRILTALSLALTFILSSAFAGVKLVGSAIGNFLTQIGTLIKNAGIVIYDSFKENGVFGSRLKGIGEYFIQCGKFLGRKPGEIANAIDDLLPKIDDDGIPIKELSKRWQRAYELSGRKIVGALNFTSETLQSVLPTTKYVVDDYGKLIMKDDNSEYKTTDIDENDYKERRAELFRRIGRGLTTAYDSAGKVITDTGIVLGKGASAIYVAGIYLIGIPQIVIDKLKELLPSQQVDGSGEFNGTEIKLEDKTEEFKEKINVLKIRINSGKATSSEILAGVLLSPVGSFGFYMGILADKLSEAIAYVSTSAGIKNVFLGIWLESGKVAKNIGDQIDIMQRSIRGQELTDEDRNTLNNVGIKSINDLNDKLWKNLTYAKDISEIADFAIKSDPIEDISQTLQATYFSTVSLLERLSDSMNILWNATKIWFGNKLNSILEFSNFILDSLRNGIPVIVTIAVSGAAGIGKFVLGLTGATILIATNSLGVVSYCFIKIISSAFYTLKTSGIVLAAIFNPVTQIGKYPIKWIIWIFKLGSNIMSFGFVRKYYKDLSDRLSKEKSITEEVVPFLSTPALQDEVEDQELPAPPTGGNRHTRRHLLRSKPSRFKTHRTYGLH